MKDKSENNLCDPADTITDGYVLCIVKGSKLQLGAQIYIVAEDKKNVWNKATYIEYIPVNNYQASYNVTMFQPITLSLSFLDSKNAPAVEVPFQIKGKDGNIKGSSKTDSNGKAKLSWNDGKVNVDD